MGEAGSHNGGRKLCPAHPRPMTCEHPEDGSREADFLLLRKSGATLWLGRSRCVMSRESFGKLDDAERPHCRAQLWVALEPTEKLLDGDVVSWAEPIKGGERG